jgi:site-specific recombinase XerD
MPLTDGLINLTGRSNDKDALIFPLPLNPDVNKQLRKWAKESGVNKHLSYHCARHSFAVNVLSRGADIKTVSSLLGHSSLVMTEKYTRVVDELKQKAIQSLPDLF